MQTKKIAIVSHVNPFSNGSGQVERVYNTLLALASEWNTITIYTLLEHKSSASKIETLKKINNEITIVYIKNRRPNIILRTLYKFLPYLGYGKDSNFSIPYLFNPIENELEHKFDVVLFEYWYLHKMAKRLKAKGLYVICDTHNILFNSYKEFIGKKSWMPIFYKTYLIEKYKKLEFEIALKDNFNLLLAINKKEELFFKKHFVKQEVYYFPMGIKFNPFDISTKIYSDKKEFVLLYYGGLGSERNYKAALTVINEIKKIKNLAIHLKIIGSNPPKFLEDIANKSSNITLLGFVEDLTSAFQDVDLAVIPFEGKYGFRSRIIELMHFGLPIITTYDSVWGMGFDDDKEVFIYSGNLDDKITNILKDSNLRKKIAFNAKQKVENEFSFEKTYLKFSKDLNKIIKLKQA